MAPIYPLATLYHDYGHGHDDDHGRDRDGDRHNGNGHGHGDDGHDHDGDDVRHGCGHGCFVFHIFIHNKPPRGLRRPANNNKKTYSTFILFFKSTTLVGFKSYLLNMF